VVCEEPIGVFEAVVWRFEDASEVCGSVLRRPPCEPENQIEDAIHRACAAGGCAATSLSERPVLQTR
jgi:hypothetical protein